MMLSVIRAAMAGMALTALAGTAMAEGKSVTLTVAVDSPGNSNICSGYLKDWVDHVEKVSDGRLKFDLVCDGVLAKVGNTIDRVGFGVADIGWDVPGIYGKRFDPLNVVGVPGLFEDPGVAGAALWDLYEAGKFKVDWGNTRPLWLQAVQNTSFFFHDAPNAPDDFTGKKVASSNALRALLTREAGGVPVSLPTSEYYQALSKGSADAVMTTPGAVEASALTEVVKHVVSGPFGGGITAVVINKDSYAALPDDLKKILDENTGKVASRIVSDTLYKYEEDFMKTKFLSRPGTDDMKLSDADLATWEPRFKKAQAQWAGDVSGGDDLLAAFSAAIDQERSAAQD